MTPCPRPPRRSAALHAGRVSLLMMLLLLPAARAGDDRDTERDHERARAAVQAGEVLPLPSLLDKLQRTHPGQVLELELEREHGRWVYEVRLLQAGGQLLKLEVDAATGRVLEARRRKPEPPAPVKDTSR